MKKIIGLFIVVLISIGLADLINGIILTFMYTPDIYTASNLKMVKLLQYTISAMTVTIVVWSVLKVRNKMKSAKSSVKVS